MSPTLDAQAKHIFHEAIEQSGPARAGYLERACAGNPELRARVEALLAAAEKDDAFLGGPTVSTFDATRSDAPGERPGARIGRYKLLQEIGEGGFGTVFMAEQSEPVVRRVALKVIKLGMDTRQVISRFEAERQALAMMDHANIARVLDAGATESGRPYFVMELVRGEPITRYCDRARLPVAQRLRLFQDVCHAVQHAHQKGIIHRDIKPSNVLVTVADGEPLAKVIDFGIAKATGARLTDKTLFTELHQLIGTPEYMSPEQAETSGVDIDTRSDIYALGVLLYELLTGSTPIEGRRLRAAPLAEIQQLICGEEPPRPSLRLATLASSSGGWRLASARRPARDVIGDSSVVEIAHRRCVEPLALTRALRGDLDRIVMKCLEKDRRRRFQTASEVAEDIDRYLRNEPVLATPPSAAYKLRKFARRNRAGVIAGVTVTSTLLIAAGVSIAFGIREAQQREAADRARDQVERVAEFQEQQLAHIDAPTMGARLRASLIAAAQTAAQRSKLSEEEAAARVAELEKLIAGSDFTGMALDALGGNVFQPAVDAIQKQFAGEPLLQARLLQTLASTLRELGMLDAASEPQEEALAIRRRLLGHQQTDTLFSLNEMGALLLAQGKLAEAEVCMRESFEVSRRVLGEDHPVSLTSLTNMGALCRAQGRLPEAEAYYREALDRCRRVLGAENGDTLLSMSKLGKVLHEEGKLSEAEPYLREALAARRRALGDDHPSTLISMSDLATLLQDQGKPEEAEPLYREALEKFRQRLGDDHPDTLSAIENMSYVLQARGELAEAEPYEREALEKSRELLGDDHPNTLTSLNNMGALLRSEGQLTEAESYYREALERRRRVLGDDHPDTLVSVSNLGLLLMARGEYSEAESLLREALVRRRQVLGEEHPDTLVAFNNLSVLLQAEGRLEEAEPLQREALDGFRRLLGEDHPTTLILLRNMAMLLLRRGKPAEAIALLEPAEPATREAFTGGNAPRLGRFLLTLGRARLAQGDFQAAEANLSEAQTIMSTAESPSPRDRSETLRALVELYEDWHAKTPGQGYNQRAAEWRARLHEWEASTQTATP